MTVVPPPEPRRVGDDPAAVRAFAEELVARVDKTLARASEFSEEQLQRRVDNEWSTVESIRHLVFVVDAWLSKTVMQETDPFHAIGLPPHFVPEGAASPSIDAAARPSFEEACDVLHGRLKTLRAYTGSVSDDALRVPINNHAKTVSGGLGVLFDEFAAHDYFMNRDLDKLSSTS